jgi:biotin carboxylase
VVATVYRERGRLGRLAPAAVSRFVDRTYPVPTAIQDWRRGNIREENTPAEEAYIRAILEICHRERIDTIFPSWDPKVCVFSRNKPRFAERGITIPVPEWGVLGRMMDKHALMQAAEKAGFPCPRTRLPASWAEAVELAGDLGFPLVVKPRFSSGAHGVRLVRDPDALAAAVRAAETTYGLPMLQEWIPGGLTQLVNVAVTLDRHGRVVSLYTRRVLRTVFRALYSVSSAEIAWTSTALESATVRFLQHLGYVGHARAEIQVDPRDGVGKLMEINCRPGYRVWCEIAAGQDIPLLCLKVERGEPIDPCPRPDDDLATFLNPVEDALACVVSLLTRARPSAYRDATLGPLPSIRELFRGYRETYRAEHVHLDRYFRALADDPVAALSWYASHLASGL